MSHIPCLVEVNLLQVRKRGSERLPSVPTVTQQICNGVRIRTKTCLQILCSYAVGAKVQVSQVQP